MRTNKIKDFLEAYKVGEIRRIDRYYEDRLSNILIFNSFGAQVSGKRAFARENYFNMLYGLSYITREGLSDEFIYTLLVTNKK